MCFFYVRFFEIRHGGRYSNLPIFYISTAMVLKYYYCVRGDVRRTLRTLLYIIYYINIIDGEIRGTTMSGAGKKRNQQKNISRYRATVVRVSFCVRVCM